MNEALEKIRNYKKGFTFTVYFYKVPKELEPSLRKVLSEAIMQGLIKSTSIGLGWDEEGNFRELEQHFVRL